MILSETTKSSNFFLQMSNCDISCLTLLYESCEFSEACPNNVVTIRGTCSVDIVGLVVSARDGNGSLYLPTFTKLTFMKYIRNQTVQCRQTVVKGFQCARRSIVPRRPFPVHRIIIIIFLKLPISGCLNVRRWCQSTQARSQWRSLTITRRTKITKIPPVHGVDEMLIYIYHYKECVYIYLSVSACKCVCVCARLCFVV